MTFSYFIFWVFIGYLLGTFVFYFFIYPVFICLLFFSLFYNKYIKYYIILDHKQKYKYGITSSVFNNIHIIVIYFHINILTCNDVYIIKYYYMTYIIILYYTFTKYSLCYIVQCYSMKYMHSNCITNAYYYYILMSIRFYRHNRRL